VTGTPPEHPDPADAPAPPPPPGTPGRAEPPPRPTPGEGTRPAEHSTPAGSVRRTPGLTPTQRPAPDTARHPGRQSGPEAAGSERAGSERAATERAAALRAVFAASPRPGRSPEYFSRDLRGRAAPGAVRGENASSSPDGGPASARPGPARSGSPATGRPATPGSEQPGGWTPSLFPAAGAPSPLGTEATAARPPAAGTAATAARPPAAGTAAAAGRAPGGGAAADRNRRRRLWLVPVIAGALALGAVAGGIAVNRMRTAAADGTAAPSGGQAGARPETTGAAGSVTPSVAPTVAPSSAAASLPSPSATTVTRATPSVSPTVTGRANPGGTNLALRRTATASSVESAPWPASAAVDGSMESRWSSGFADPQWIKVDLGAVWQISAVRLAWEHAYALSYRVDLSLDGSHWTTTYRTTAGTDGVRDIPVAKVPARYVRVYGIKRVSQYGYSLQELEVR
jgi:F5/8 type C domain-containing protein